MPLTCHALSMDDVSSCLTDRHPPPLGTPAPTNNKTQIFLGTLREIELERVKEKLSSAIMETCLALTIFREEFNIGFVGMFTVLTFVKVGAQGWCVVLFVCVCIV